MHIGKKYRYIRWGVGQLTCCTAIEVKKRWNFAVDSRSCLFLKIRIDSDKETTRKIQDSSRWDYVSNATVMTYNNMYNKTNT